MGVQVRPVMAMKVLSRKRAQRSSSMELKGFMSRENLSMGMAHADSEKK
jgi:hypothetical protein